jgi:hypothetical protein
MAWAAVDGTARPNSFHTSYPIARANIAPAAAVKGRADGGISDIFGWTIIARVFSIDH